MFCREPARTSIDTYSYILLRSMEFASYIPGRLYVYIAIAYNYVLSVLSDVNVC